MALDIFIPSLIGAAIGFIALLGIIRIKGIWLVGALLYMAGGMIAFLTAHVLFYYLVVGTHYVFIPGVCGFIIWSFVFVRLILTGRTRQQIIDNG